jgi:hypothetical protein
MNARDRDVLREKAEARLRRLGPERRALEAAVFAVSPEVDLQEFVDAFNAASDERLNQTRAVERNFEIIHNYLVEIIRFGLELSGELQRSDRANAPRDVRTIQRLGIVDRRHADLLIKLHEVRSGLQHWYPDIVGTEVHAAVEDLLGSLGYLERTLRAWHEGLG